MDSNIAFYEAIRYEYDLNENSIVFDIGAFCGTFADEIVRRYNCNVFAFEPVYDFFKTIKEGEKVKKFNFAVSDQDKKDKIYVNGASTSAYCGGEEVEIQFRDIYALICDIEKIDLMKINIEGEEFRVLPRMISTGIIQKCENIQIQYHPFIKDADSMRTAINSELEKTHTQTWCFPFVWENWRKK